MLFPAFYYLPRFPEQSIKREGAAIVILRILTRKSHRFGSSDRVNQWHNCHDPSHGWPGTEGPPVTQVDNFLHIPLVYWVLEMEGRMRTPKSWNICHWPWSLRGRSRNNVILHRFTLVFVGDSNQDLLFSSLAFPEIVSAIHELCEHIQVTQEWSFQV